MYSFDTYIRVEYVDTDKMGVVHNSNYFRYFERARCETMRDIDVNYKDIEAAGLIMPVIEQYAKYISPAYYDDLLIVRTTISDFPSVRMRFDYQVLKRQNEVEKLLCQGFNVLAFMKPGGTRPQPCPEWVMEKLHRVL